MGDRFKAASITRDKLQIKDFNIVLRGKHSQLIEKHLFMYDNSRGRVFAVRHWFKLNEFFVYFCVNRSNLRF